MRAALLHYFLTVVREIGFTEGYDGLTIIYTT